MPGPPSDDGRDAEPLPAALRPGTVVRIGDTVRRPIRAGSEAVWALLRYLEEVGFDQAPRFLGTDDAGREVLSYIPGQVGIPPFPSWVMTNQALAETARLLHRYHEAVSGFPLEAVDGWRTGLADPEAADLVCHNDLGVENVVFRDGQAVGLLDFDFAAPGRRIWDVAMAARMWAPLTCPRFRSAWPDGLDAVARIGVFARAYGLRSELAEYFVEVLLEACLAGTALLRQRAEAGEPGFAEIWKARGGDERARLDQDWATEHRSRFREVVLAEGLHGYKA